MSKDRIRFKFSTAQTVIIGFTALIALGTALLLLPFASEEKTSFTDAFFTATSASCVTGLVTQNTATHWTLFGKAVIISLIQIGGMGVITMTVFASMIFRRKLSLSERNAMQETLGSMKLQGVLPLTRFIVVTTVVIELSGAAIMSPVFCNRFGIKGIFYAIFHSISAFCNAGFDVLGYNKPFSSLTEYSDNSLINITVMLLIITGGIGFMTWDDIKTHKFRVRKYRMQSRVILFVTSVLVIVPAIVFYFFEFADYSAKNRILASLFQSVTLRTAGFNTVDLNSISPSVKVLMIMLMLIGAAPASTGGGMKVTTVSVLAASVIGALKRKKNTDMFGRRVSDTAIRNAAAIFFIYIVLFLSAGLMIASVENIDLLDSAFETASAIGTVGLTMGITPQLCVGSKIILIILMFLGRVGGLTFVFATVSGRKTDSALLPLEEIMVG